MGPPQKPLPPPPLSTSSAAHLESTSEPFRHDHTANEMVLSPLEISYPASPTLRPTPSRNPRPLAVSSESCSFPAFQSFGFGVPSHDDGDGTTEVYRRPSLQERRTNSKGRSASGPDEVGGGLTCEIAASSSSAARHYSEPTTPLATEPQAGADRFHPGSASGTPRALESRVTYLGATPIRSISPNTLSQQAIGETPTLPHFPVNPVLTAPHQELLERADVDYAPYGPRTVSTNSTRSSVDGAAVESLTLASKLSFSDLSSHKATWSRFNMSLSDFEGHGRHSSSNASVSGTSTRAGTPESEDHHSSFHHSLHSHPRTTYFSESHGHHHSPLIYDPVESGTDARAVNFFGSPPDKPKPIPLPRLDSNETRQALLDQYLSMSRESPLALAEGKHGGSVESLVATKRKEQQRNKASTARAVRDSETALGAGSFGQAVRVKVQGVFERGLGGIILSARAGETISIVEYEALHGLSFGLVQPIITQLDAALPKVSSRYFQVLHQDARSDFRQYSISLGSSEMSYNHATFLDGPVKPLRDRVFGSTTTAPFTKKVSPPGQVSVGFSLFGLHWTHSPVRTSLSLHIDAELRAFLAARASEFKPSGLLVLSFLMGSGRSSTSTLIQDQSSLARRSTSPRITSARPIDSESGTNDDPVTRTRGRRADSLMDPKSTGDVWRQLSSTLSVCVMRLVSIGSIRSSTAPLLLSLPLWTRSPKELAKSLSHEDVTAVWTVEESYGLQDGIPGEEFAGTGPVKILHPAYRALVADTLSRTSYAEHVTSFVKTLYESHFRSVLIEKGGQSRGTAEMTLQSLFSILTEKVEEGVLDGLQLEFGIVALRRRW